MDVLIVVGVLILCAVIWHLINKYFKFPKCDSLTFVDGGVKSGKSTFSFAMAWATFKRNLRNVKIRNFFAKMLSKPLEELPLFYSSIPVNVPHVLLTLDMLKRDVRFAYKSVIWIDEASLLADSMCYKNIDINDQICLFTKLIAHETKGGSLFINSQCINDLHYGFKRNVSRKFYVYNTYKWLPFLLICDVVEERYSDEQSMQVYTEDIEPKMRRVIIPKSVWKKFDCYCYSSMTDELPVVDTLNENSGCLKAQRLVSFNPRHNIVIGEEKNEQKEN